jgi:hypothetical protein
MNAGRNDGDPERQRDFKARKGNTVKTRENSRLSGIALALL